MNTQHRGPLYKYQASGTVWANDDDPWRNHFARSLAGALLIAALFLAVVLAAVAGGVE